MAGQCGSYITAQLEQHIVTYAIPLPVRQKFYAMLNSCLWWAVLLLSGICAFAKAEIRSNPEYLHEVLARAALLNLAAAPEWQRLLHYRASTAGLISDADDPHFFLAPHGKTNPEAELEATIRAFFSDQQVGVAPQPVQCAFIARYRWLKERLDFDSRYLVPQHCQRFAQWREAVNVEAATLVFASAYMNNPASLFGHTLLRLDQRGQTEATRLLAYAVSYAADDTQSNALTYAFDGIAGGFSGRFDMQPYYQMVRTYSDLESRDLWEYRLNLSAPQLERLLEHVWELRGIKFTYYFFRENCAWQLLTLLEVANPELKLSEQFRLWTLPADAVRSVVAEAGLVENVTARPARNTHIQRRYAHLSATEAHLARRLWQNSELARSDIFTALPVPRQALLLELALEQRQAQHPRATQAPNQATQSLADPGLHELLSARQALRVAAPPIAIEPVATRPELGHASRRFGLGFGQRNAANFVELQGRASYHDLLEADAGYTPDAQIELLALGVRHYSEHNRWRLDRFTLLDITSLAPLNSLNPRPSWRMHAGWQAIPSAERPYRGAFNLSAGLGLAAETTLLWRSVWFAWSDLELDYGAALTDEHRAGWGFSTGAVLQLQPAWKMLVNASWVDYRSGEQDSGLRAVIAQNVMLQQHLALRIEGRYWQGISEFSLGLHSYF